ncbi:MAG: thioredoxin family protein [Candidatus Omnitrophica bacterium]|nr:thioredoxin family protein [Candidatus Omnitrophota bacterium]
MALLESVLVPLNGKMPDFELQDPSGKSYKASAMIGEKDRGLLVVFTCNHCPYALAVWPRVIKMAKYAKGMRVHTLAVNPNIHPDYPEDSAENMKKKIQEWGLDFPYLVDEAQATAKAYKAQCTPDIYLLDREMKLVYHGRIDDSWQDESKVTHEELKEALNNFAAGLPVDRKQNPSMGCSIKWRA